jgi:hypothetical protein
MGSVLARSIMGLAPLAVVVAAFGASAAPIFVGFDSDIVPTSVVGNFTSNDSSQILFRDSDLTDGSNLAVLEFNGSNVLAVGIDDDSGLLMEFDFIASALSLDFGNTSLADFGDTAVLTVFLNGTQVGSAVTVALNQTDPVDQTISYAGASFNSAILSYNVAGGLTEVVDNIYITPSIPEPHAGLVFGVGALIVGAVCGRRSATEARLSGMQD